MSDDREWSVGQEVRVREELADEEYKQYAGMDGWVVAERDEDDRVWVALRNPVSAEGARGPTIAFHPEQLTEPAVGMPLPTGANALAIGVDEIERTLVREDVVEGELLGMRIRMPRTMRIEIQVDESTWRVIDWPLDHHSMAIDDYGVSEVPAAALIVDPTVIAKVLLKP